MHEFETSSEPTFDDREQQEIIAMAARLQREAGQSMTLSELERVATEAGIEPRFVREAVRRQSSPRLVVSAGAAPVNLPQSLVWCAALLLLQGIAMAGALAYGPKMSATLFGSAVGLLFGLFASRHRSLSRLAPLVPAAAIFVDLVIFVLAQASVVSNSEISKILFGMSLGQGLIAWGLVGLTNWWTARNTDRRPAPQA